MNTEQLEKKGDYFRKKIIQVSHIGAGGLITSSLSEIDILNCYLIHQIQNGMEEIDLC